MKQLIKILLTALIFLLPCNSMAAEEYFEQYELRTCTLNISMTHGGYIEIENYTDINTQDYIRLPDETDVYDSQNPITTSVTIGYLYDKINGYSKEPMIHIQAHQGYECVSMETDFMSYGEFGNSDIYNVTVVFEVQMTPWLFIDEDTYYNQYDYCDNDGNFPEFKVGTLILGNNSYTGNIQYKVALDEYGIFPYDQRENVEYNGYSYEVAYAAPWDDHRDKIKNIIIWDGIYDVNYFDNFASLDLRKYKNLESIIIPPSMTNIPFDMGAYPSLKNISVSSSKEQNYDISSDYTTKDGVLYKYEYLLVKYPPCKEDESFTVPENVTSIEQGAFSDCSNLKTISLPDGLKNILAWSFRDCSNLTEITVPKNVEHWEFGIFQNCTSLKSFTLLSEKVSQINYDFFSGCKRLNNINLSKSIGVINDGAFSGCTSLKTYAIPESVSLVGDGAFSGCTGLENVYLSSEMTYLADRIFEDCTSLRYVYLPEGLKRIESFSFNNCTQLSQITIPQSVTYIDDYAFSNCEQLYSLNISKNVEFFSPLAINSCANLSYFTIDENNTNYCFENGIIYTKDKTTLVRCLENNILAECTIPNDVTIIGSFAFRNCSNIKKIKLSPYLTTIQQYAFTNCKNLTDIIIPSTVEQIQFYSFSDCESLKNVYYCGSLNDWINITIGRNNNELIYADKTYNYKTTYSSYINKNGIILISILITDDIKNNMDCIITAGYTSTDSFSKIGQQIQSSDDSYLMYMLDAENIHSVKIFVWDSNMIPITVNENLNIKQ